MCGADCCCGVAVVGTLSRPLRRSECGMWEGIEGEASAKRDKRVLALHFGHLLDDGGRGRDGSRTGREVM